MSEDKAHVYRAAPPWRQGPPLTECGRAPESVAGPVLRVEELVAKWRREGQARAAYTTCMTCLDRARVYQGHRRGEEAGEWERDPVAVVARDGRWGSPVADLARRELHALAGLAAAHPEEFAALLSARDELRAARERRRHG